MGLREFVSAVLDLDVGGTGGRFGGRFPGLWQADGWPPLHRGTRDHDVLDGSSGRDHLGGGWGRDLIDGGAGHDLLRGGLDEDRIRAGDGHDRVFGGPGEDTITGGNGRDMLFGGHDDDRIGGDAGRDLLHGGHGNDWLSGGFAADTLIGGAGADTMEGGQGADLHVGGSGADVYLFAGDFGNDRIVGFQAGHDKIVISGATLADLTFTKTALGVRIDVNQPGGDAAGRWTPPSPSPRQAPRKTTSISDRRSRPAVRSRSSAPTASPRRTSTSPSLPTRTPSCWW